MLTRKEAQKITDKIIRFSRADQTEVIILNNNESLTRYANNVITQNVHKSEEVTLMLRVIKGGRTARVTTNRLDNKSLQKVVDTALELARHQQRDPKLLGLTSKQSYIPLDTYVERTAQFSPRERANAIHTAITECQQNNLQGSGIFSNSAGIVVIANSRGLFGYHQMSETEFTLTAISSDSSGWAAKADKDVDTINTREIARQAIEKALKGQNPKGIPAGQYTVILEAAASAQLLAHMAFATFGALQYQEGRSFLSGKIGRKIAGNNITIIDDVYHPQSMGMPFDFEGMPRRKVALINKGTARGVVYDRETARKEGRQSTGHALPQPNPHGPISANLVIMPGDSSLNDMITSTNKGILITEFHYTNVLDPMKMTLTGLTRNGTFLIENGRITQGIKNMRFTESVIKAFSNVALISRETRFSKGFFGGGFVTPALKINRFNFSSGTKF